MKKILVVEDNEAHRKILEKLLEDIKDIEILIAETVEKAYKISMEKTIALFLVDIILNTKERGDVSGLKFVEAIRQIPKYLFTPLIFITSLEDPQLYAYKELHCFGYIEKPFNPDSVTRLIRQALQFPMGKREPKNIYFRNEGVMYSINSNDIIYIESSKRKLLVHTIKETWRIPYKTCKEILQDLDSEDFIQCSRYIIINKNYVNTIDYVNRYIKLKGVEKAVDIGISMKKRVMDEFCN